MDEVITASHIGRLLEGVLANAMSGKMAFSRNTTSREKLGVSMRLEDVRNNVLDSPVRNLNHRFVVAEWLWIVFGMNRLDVLTKYNKKMAEFSDDGKTLAGAYGPRLLPQVQYLIDALRSDPWTRQAVATIWTPNPRPSRDIPCTVAVQLLIRDNQLNGIFTMRSSDSWIGLPIDIFAFSQIINMIAGMLGVRPGWLQINAGSSHVYEKDWETATEFIGSAYNIISSPLLSGPPPVLLMHTLTGSDCGDDPLIEEPWLRYGKVLCSKTSAQALEHLR